VRAEVVNVSWQHEASVKLLCQVHAGMCQRQRFAGPAGVRRVQAVHQYLRAGCLCAQGLQIVHSPVHQQGARRHADCRSAAQLRQHPPACCIEGLCGGQAKAAVGAEDENGGAGGGGHVGEALMDCNDVSLGPRDLADNCLTMHSSHTLTHGFKWQ